MEDGESDSEGEGILDKEKRQFQELFPDVPLEEDEAIFKKKRFVSFTIATRICCVQPF